MRAEGVEKACLGLVLVGQMESDQIFEAGRQGNCKAGIPNAWACDLIFDGTSV